MDLIDSSLANGIEERRENCGERKPIIVKSEMVGETSSQRLNHSPSIAFRVPVETNLNNTGGVSYRVVPLKVEPSMDQLSEGDSPVPIAPILTTHLSAEGNEPRLALIASSEPSPEQTVVVSGGQVYLISDTTNVTSGTRSFLPRTSDSVLSQRMSSTREEKRRVIHNEVERRRRDKINHWICKLAKILPDCSEMQTKTSQVSKGAILAKACDYIEDLRNQIRILSDRVSLQDLKQSQSDIEQQLEILKSENNALRNDNALLKAQLSRHGILDDLAS